MNKQVKLSALMMITFGLLLFCITLPVSAVDKTKDKPVAVKIKPDIVIHSLTVAKTGETPTGDHKVRVTVIVRNACIVNSCTGPFKIKFEWTQDPTVGFNLLGEAGVANLCTDISRAAAITETRFFDDVVPAGQFKKYRITADHLNSVDEANEANNIDAVGYTTVH